MRLNRLENLLMNNPVRGAMQRYVEAAQLARLGGMARDARAREIGCGRGGGVEIIYDRFAARQVDAFDLDPGMVGLVRQRLARLDRPVALWVADATAIPVADGTYDAVFDFGMVHHVPRWRGAVAEVFRVLRPGGRFYAEEVLARFVTHPIIRRLLRHPQEDRFDGRDFTDGLAAAGFRVHATRQILRGFGWFVADKPGVPE